MRPGARVLICTCSEKTQTHRDRWSVTQRNRRLAYYACYALALNVFLNKVVVMPSLFLQNDITSKVPTRRIRRRSYQCRRELQRLP
jgi:hypothetical protein